MKSIKMWFVLVVTLLGFSVFTSDVGAARIPAAKKLIELTFNQKGELVVRFDKSMLRGRMTPESLDEDPVVVAEISNGYFQSPSTSIDPKFVVQQVTGNPRELEFPARVVGFDQGCQCLRFTTGRLDPDTIIRKKWTFTFELRSDQIGGGIRQVSNPPIPGILPGTTSFAIDIPRDIFEMLTGTAVMHVEGKFLLVPSNMLPTLNGQILLAFDGNHWHSDPEFHLPGKEISASEDFDLLVEDGKGFFRVPICGLKDFSQNKKFNIGVSSSRNGLIDADKWLKVDKNRVGEGVAAGDINYVLTLTDQQIADRCK